jgi:hypothetical protein
VSQQVVAIIDACSGHGLPVGLPAHTGTSVPNRQPRTGCAFTSL